MASVALITMAAIPAAYTAVGIALIVLALTCAALFVWKLREANTLRKEVMELRDTMRMMRYEEANLARMLHTADKPMPTTEGIAEEPQEMVTEDTEPTEDIETVEFTETTEAIEAIETTEAAETTEAIEPAAEETTEEPIAATIEAPAKETVVEPIEEPTVEVSIVENTAIEDTTIEESIVENTAIEDTVIEEPIVENTAIEDTTIEEPIVENTVVVEAPMPTARSRKQTIKERCPAIPNDLFAAWFEENDNALQTIEADKAPTMQPPSENIPEQPTAVSTQESQPETSPAEESESIKGPDNTESTAATAVTSHPTQDETLPMSRENERFCRKLERTIQTRMRNPNLNVDIIAAQFGLGRTNFYRKVRELTGMSPNDYLRKCRMTKAAELLQNTELTISDICAQVGIPDAQYFSRVFKTHFGVSPSVYREQ